jgi:hypothetical protein
VADVVDHPLGDQELRQLGQAPGGERQVMVLGTRQGELLDRSALGQGERRRAATAVARVQRVEPVGVEVVQHVADPVGAGEGDLGDRRHGHALGAQQDHLGSPPGHHRPGRAPQDPQQPLPFLVGDLPNPHPLGHWASLGMEGPVSATAVGSAPRGMSSTSDGSLPGPRPMGGTARRTSRWPVSQDGGPPGAHKGAGRDDIRPLQRDPRQQGSTLTQHRTRRRKHW